MKRAIVIALLLLASCQADQQQAAPKKDPISAGVLVDFGDFTFVEAEDETASNLEAFLRETIPERYEIIDTTVRSVHRNGEPAGAEVIAAALDRGKVELRRFYLQILNALTPGKGQAIADGRAVLIASEGTTVVATFPTEEVLLYMVGEDDDLMEELTVSLLRLNGG